MAHNKRAGQLQALTALALGLVITGSYAQGLPPPPTDRSGNTVPANVKVPEFDVVSIKPHKGDDGMERWMSTPDGISVTNIPLQSMAASAYEIKMDLVSGGPSWMKSMGFDVEAKVAGSDVQAYKGISSDKRDLMLRALLADRFQLKAHVETKTLPIYELVVAKSGLRMKRAAPEVPEPDAKPGDPPKNRGMMRMGPGGLEAKDYDFSSLANQLGYIVQRTVVDKTGLKGKYDFTLKWTPEDQAAGAGAAADAGTEAAPSIFTAVEEQLGLKLNSSKGPVETLVVDRAEMPADN